MLILSRKMNERIFAFIGETRIEIKVVKIHGNKVRLGFHAPPDVSFHREELYEAV